MLKANKNSLTNNAGFYACNTITAQQRNQFSFCRSIPIQYNDFFNYPQFFHQDTTPPSSRSVERFNFQIGTKQSKARSGVGFFISRRDLLDSFVALLYSIFKEPIPQKSEPTLIFKSYMQIKKKFNMGWRNFMSSSK